MASLNFIHHSQLKRYWEYVRKGVERINARCKDRWSAEDLYMFLKLEKAALYMVDGDGVNGFFVLQENYNFDGKELHIFAGYSDTVDIMEYASPLLKDEARRLGCIRITFLSSRTGWEKRAEQLGCKKVSVNYEMEL